MHILVETEVPREREKRKENVQIKRSPIHAGADHIRHVRLLHFTNMRNRDPNGENVENILAICFPMEIP